MDGVYDGLFGSRHQNTWGIIISDNGSTSPSKPNSSFSILGGNGVETSIVGDVLTIDADINTTNLKFTSLEINTIQDIHTGASPTFAGITLTGLTQGSVIFISASGVITEDNPNFFWDNVNKRLGINTNSPATGAGLDIVTQTFKLGADFAAGSPPPDSITRTNATLKVSGFIMPHYTKAEEDFMFFRGVTTSTDNQVIFGGSTGAFNAATLIRFFTGATNTTLTGTERMRIISDGKIGINETVPTSLLHIKGQDSTSSTSSLNITDSGSNTMLFVRDDGKIGIGLTTPGFNVDIEHNFVGSGGLRTTQKNSAGSSNFFVENNLGNRMNQFMDGSTLAASVVFGITRQDIGGLVSTGATGSPFVLGTLEDFDLTIGTNNIARITVKNDGKVGIGTTIPAGIVDIATSAGNNLIYLTTNSSTDTNRSLLRFRKSGSDTIGDFGETADNERLGLIDWSGVGSDEDSFDQSAFIQVIQDGAAGTTVVPTEMLFGTSPGGTTAPVTRLKIAPGGAITFNTAYTFPTADGSAGQVLQTDGGGNLSFVAAGGGQDIWFTMTGDAGSVSANTTTDSFDIGGGTGISTAISGDGVIITNTSPNIVQDLWDVITADTGSTTADSPTDNLTIAGGTNVSTVIVGDILTINTTGTPDQDLWETITGDTGTVTANTTTDSFDVGGGVGISTAISGDGIIITNDAPNIVQNLFETIMADSGTNPVADGPTDTLNIVGGEGINTVGDSSTDTITISGEDATTTNKGIVELATDVETNTGTDTIRAITPSNLGQWPGTTNITTLGTIATGTWEGDTIAVDQGGTGQTSYTNGQLLIGNTTGNTLAKATLTEGDGIDITNAAGSITLAADINTTNLKFTATEINTIQDIDVTASPTFVGITLSGLTEGSIVFAGSGGVISEDNANLFFDDTANALGLGTNSPDASSILDITSTTKGLLPPRMTQAQRDAISSPADGLTVYNTDTNRIATYNGTAWYEREVNNAADSGVSSTTGTAFVEKDKLTFTPTDVGDWKIEVYAEIFSEDSGTRVNVRLHLDDTTVLAIADNTVDPSQTTGFNTMSMIVYISALTAASHDFDFDFSSTQAGKEVQVRNSHIIATRVT